MQGACNVVGWALIVLSVLSGLALFVRAVAPGVKDDGSRQSTLWGLFLVGLVAGFILLNIAEHIGR